MTQVQEQSRVVHFYYTPFIVDILLRWLALGVYRWRVAPNHETQDFILFFAEQILITVLTVIWVNYRFRKLKEKHSFLNESFFEEKVSLFSIAFRIFNVLCITYILANVIAEQQFYKDFVGVRQDGSQYVIYFFIFLLYSGIILYLSFSSIRVSQNQYDDFVSVPSVEPLPIAKWIDRLAGRKASKEPIQMELPDKDLFLDPYNYQIDHNDLEIIKIEGRLRNEHSRIEAYILESVMFGALAFSGFLSIIASERFNLTILEREELLQKQVLLDNRALVEATETDSTLVLGEGLQANATGQRVPVVKTTEMRIFWEQAIELLDNILLFKFKEASVNWNKLIQPSNLIMLIAIQTLFCALFFLSVIASRLRYTRMTEEIDNLVRLARNFNDKEEEVHNLVLQGLGNEEVQENLRRRLKSLGLKIGQYLDRAADLLSQTRPILIYMSLFRNLGVISFIFILITSSLFFSKTLATIFLVFSIVAYVYEYVDIKLRMRG